MAEYKPSLLDLAREARAAVGDRLAVVLGAVAVVPLVLLALHALFPSYTARADVTFTRLPAEIGDRLPVPARVLASDAVVRDLEGRVRDAGLGDEFGSLPDRLTVLQPRGTDSAQLVTRAGTRDDARFLAEAWFAAFLDVRGRQIRSQLSAAERRVQARIRSARPNDRGPARAALVRLVGLRRNLPGGTLDGPATDEGRAVLVPWWSPLAGLALGVALAAALGLRDRKVRTAALLRRLGGPPLLGRLKAGHSDLGLAASRIAALGRDRLLLSPLGPSQGAAMAVARAAEGAEVLTGTGIAVADPGAAQASAGPADAWVLVVPLGELTAEELRRAFRDYGAGRVPDGMVAVTPARWRARRPSASRPGPAPLRRTAPPAG